MCVDLGGPCITDHNAGAEQPPPDRHRSAAGRRDRLDVPRRAAGARGDPRADAGPFLDRSALVLMRLLLSHLRPYRRPLLAVVGLQFVSTMAALYLPSLNADIIDRGVATGDTGYIVRHGGLMLAVSLIQ